MTEGTATSEVRATHRFDEDRLAGFLRDRLPDVGGALTVRQFGYGQSNPTFLLRFPNAEYVLRKQPPGDLLPSAHAVDREYRVQDALAGTGVPVAKMMLFSDDRSVIGTPFYVMERKVGRVFTDSALPGTDIEERRPMYLAAAATLAKLHSVDPAAVGLADFGRPGSYYERQFNRWGKNYRQTKTREIPEMDLLMEAMPRHMPAGDETTIVHGDYRIGNLMFHPTKPEVIAVFDWELATLGHPLSDLAYCCILYYTTPEEWWGIRGLDQPALGFPTEDEFVAAYCRAAGRSDTLTDAHRAHAMFRFAAILDGVRARGLAGNAAADNAEEVGRLAVVMAERAWNLIDRLEQSSSR